MVKIMQVIAIVSSFSLLCSNAISGEKLTVLYDSGNSKTLEEYLSPLRKETVTIDPLIVKSFQDKFRLTTPMDFAFPIETPGMTPGRTSIRHINFKVPITSFFIIGDDKASVRWLGLRKSKLLDVPQLTGLVVNVANRKRFNELQRIARPLVLYAVNGTEFTKLLGITHYPVLITSIGIEQ